MKAKGMSQIEIQLRAIDNSYRDEYRHFLMWKAKHATNTADYKRYNNVIQIINKIDSE